MYTDAVRYFKENHINIDQFDYFDYADFLNNLDE